MQRRSQGMTLVELMVALVLGMVLTLAVFGVMTKSEGRRRTLSAGTDLDQSGAVAMFLIDRWVRGAGSGLGNAADFAYGCALNAAKSSTTVLPNTALPAPFTGLNEDSDGVFRLAPALIVPGNTAGLSVPAISGKPSDGLVLMSARSSAGNLPTPIADLAGAASVPLANTVAFDADDLVLLASSDGDNSAPCLLTQAASTFSGGGATLPLGGAWFAASVGSVELQGFSNPGGHAINLGNPADKLAPSFQIVAVGGHNTLYTYDLLQTSATPLRAVAEGVFEMHAVYGVDTDDDDRVDQWVGASTGDYAYGSLTDGSYAARLRLKTIKALRVGLILRTALPEKEAITTDPTLRLFTDLAESLQISRELSNAEQFYRYRTVEATIPLRNHLL